MARGAINTLREMAPKKRLTTTRERMAEREVVQMQVAQAEGLLRSGRAFLFDTVQEVWNNISAYVAPSLGQRALLRLAATQAAIQAAQAIDLMYHAAGTSSISCLCNATFRNITLYAQSDFSTYTHIYQG